MLLRARRSSKQSDINHVSYWYNNSPDYGHITRLLPIYFVQLCAHNQENYFTNTTHGLRHSV